MPDETVDVAQLRFDPKNARIHPKANLDVLEKSLTTTGAGRSILLANDGTILAGNATVEVAAQVGLHRVRVVESDGTELIAVKRTDIVDGDDPRGVQAGLYDNYSAELAEWDTERLAAFREVDEYELAEIFSTGFLAQLDQDVQGLDLDVDESFDQETGARVKRWTFQFSAEQHQTVRAVLNALVESGVVSKTEENSDVFGNALALILGEYGR